MAIKTIQVTENQDIALIGGRTWAFLQGEDALKQNLVSYGRMILKEDLYDIRNGVDYFGSVFSPTPDLDKARASITSQLLKHPDALSVESLTISIEDSALNYIAVVNTIYGEVQISNQ